MANVLVRGFNEVTEGKLLDGECVNIYKEDPDVAIAAIYRKYAGMLYSLGRKFYSLNSEDVESISFEVVDKALKTFSNKGGGNFATYLTHLMKNALKNELRALTIESVKRDWYMDVQFERDSSDEDGVVSSYDLRGTTDAGYAEIEILESVKLASVTKNQYKFVEAIIKQGKDLNDSEIAQLIGVSRSSIGTIKKGLKNKLQEIL